MRRRRYKRWKRSRHQKEEYDTGEYLSDSDRYSWQNLAPISPLPSLSPLSQLERAYNTEEKLPYKTESKTVEGGIATATTLCQDWNNSCEMNLTDRVAQIMIKTASK